MTADPDVWWGHCLRAPANGLMAHCGDLESYLRGERADVEFGAALHPEMYDSRHGFGSFYVRSGLRDGRHTSLLHETAFESNRFTLYRDGELVGTQEGFDAYFPVPDDPARFRVEHEWKLADAFSRSREARTVWTVDSAAPRPTTPTPPFLALDYGADVDGFGRAAPRKALRLDLWAGHIGLATPESHRIHEMTLRWSVDDGRSWHRSSLRRETEATFRGRVPGNALRSGRTVSLRATASDAAGNRIDQTVWDIIPVR